MSLKGRVKCQKVQTRNTTSKTDQNTTAAVGRGMERMSELVMWCDEEEEGEKRGREGERERGRGREGGREGERKEVNTLSVE